jgi:hypothetical protein
MKIRVALMFAVAISLWGWAAYIGPDGCRNYWRTEAPLIAHGGGGLPDQSYPNNLAALNLSAFHGHTLIELDMREHGGRIWFGHDEPTDLTLNTLLAWLDRHPGVSIVTDFKTGNVYGLATLKKLSGKYQSQFIPQIYRTEQYEPVLKMDYQKPIFAVGQNENSDWVEWVNNHDVRAVTVPLYQFWRDVEKPLYLHTANIPLGGVGLYTDCLIPG